LKVGFVASISFPSTEGLQTPVEDKAGPLFPDCPTCYNEELHEEIMGRLPLSILHHVVKWEIKVSVDSKIGPTVLGEVTSKE
jgi:hypothetical protein